jgi:hypothetical protein
MLPAAVVTPAMTYPSQTKEAKKAYQREWYLKNKERVLAKSRAAYQKRLQREGVCELCSKQGPIVWDHCHAQGHFRGWLCAQCNTGLGMFRDNPDVLRRAAAYIETRRKPQEDTCPLSP